MLDIFDILGPIMVGPSSSHTAGAVRIGNIARTLLGNEPVEAKLLLHGSFAETGRGHGTDQVNIANMRLRRQGKGGLAIMVIEVDQKIPQSVITSLRQFEGIRKATYYEREEA